METLRWEDDHQLMMHVYRSVVLERVIVDRAMVPQQVVYQRGVFERVIPVPIRAIAQIVFQRPSNRGPIFPAYVIDVFLNAVPRVKGEQPLVIFGFEGPVT